MYYILLIKFIGTFFVVMSGNLLDSAVDEIVPDSLEYYEANNFEEIKVPTDGLCFWHCSKEIINKSTNGANVHCRNATQAKSVVLSKIVDIAEGDDINFLVNQ